MIDLARFQRIRDFHEKAKAEASRAEGALQHQMELLHSEFQCATLEEAETLLATMIRERGEVESQYNVELSAFETQWASLMDELK
jgi:hypothetical protein